MRRAECKFEAEVAAGRMNQELAAHLSECEHCREAAMLAAEMEAAYADARAAATVPDAGLVWWKAQMRARREAERAAARPITAMQVIAFACAMGFVGACFGATSMWFQTAFSVVVEQVRVWLNNPLVAEHGLLTLVVAAMVVVVPVALCWAAGRD